MRSNTMVYYCYDTVGQSAGLVKTARGAGVRRGNHKRVCLKKWILIVLGGVAGLVVLALVAGVLLPREHRASRSAVFHQPPDVVWAAIRDFAALPAWWSEMQRVERLPDSAGHEVWRQAMSGFAMRLAVAEDEPPRHLVTRVLAADDAPFGGRWIYDLEPLPGGTRLTVTEEGWITNPFFRVVANLMGLDATITQYLRALGRKFGEDVEPA
jgi:uncharacterized protein YndB with AHSA1/START domain